MSSDVVGEYSHRDSCLSWCADKIVAKTNSKFMRTPLAAGWRRTILTRRLFNLPLVKYADEGLHAC